MSDDEEIVFGRRPVLELLRSGGSVDRILLADQTTSPPVVTEILRRAKAAGIGVRRVPRDQLDRRAHGGNHQGVVALTGAFSYATFEDLVRTPAATLLFADGLTDPHNLGSLIRSAEGAGFHGVVIPARRASGVTATVRRVAAGAAEIVPVARVTNLSQALDTARRAGLWIVGLDSESETDVWATDLLEAPVGIVVGSEDKGLSRVVRARCDAIVGIPLKGSIDSLNAGVAGALAMFEVARRAAGETRTMKAKPG